MEKIISITIDGKTYEKYKKAYESIQKNKVGIDFHACPSLSYSWTIYSKDKVFDEMIEQFKFIEYKQNEKYNSDLAKLRSIIEKLKYPIQYLNSIGFKFSMDNPTGVLMEKDEIQYNIFSLVDKISKGEI